MALESFRHFLVTSLAIGYYAHFSAKEQKRICPPYYVLESPPRGIILRDLRAGHTISRKSKLEHDWFKCFPSVFFYQSGNNFDFDFFLHICFIGSFKIGYVYPLEVETIRGTDPSSPLSYAS